MMKPEISLILCLLISSTKLRVEGNDNLPRTYAPTQSKAKTPPYPWHRNITATFFWVGESPTANNPTHNRASSWDTEWMKNYGGYDDPNPAKRTRDYRPKKFIPKLNPFYVALPYNDRINYKKTKASARSCLLYTSPSPRDATLSRMPSSA